MNLFVHYSRLSHRRYTSLLEKPILVSALVFFPVISAPGQLAPPQLGFSEDRSELIRGLSLEDLLTQEITSVSKRPENQFEAAAAVYVISGDEIRNSGARTIPEALRLAPGISVAQTETQGWAVASRGLNGVFTDRLLVLIDGRSVYQTSFGGVIWGNQDVLLEDIDRIEVVRGPGGTLWGANAVNGVINIVTKDAQQNQGFYASSGWGTEEGFFGEARYGGKMSENGYARGYLKFSSRNERPGGIDTWESLQGGTRMDWHFPNTHLTLQGDLYRRRAQTLILRPDVASSTYFTPQPLDSDFEGGNVLMRLDHDFSSESALQVQAYYSHDRLRQFDLQQESILDFEAQHRFPVTEWNRVVYGVNYRYYPSDLRDNFFFTYDPEKRNQQLFSGFIQDDTFLLDETVKITLGTKLEHNDVTGLEVQPNARVSWRPTERQTIWGAVSRAVQVPSRSSRDLAIPLISSPPLILPDVPPIFGSFTGNPDLEAQDLLGYEFGYRILPHEDLSLDAAAFYNQYDDAYGFVVGDAIFVPAPAPHVLVPLGRDNSARFNSYGFELAADWRATDWWRFQAQYSFIKLDRDDGVPLSGAGSPSTSLSNTPQQQVGLRSSWNLPGNVTFDFWARYVDQLMSTVFIENYYDLDLRLAWHPAKRWEVEIVGQNLIDSERIEFGEDNGLRSQVTVTPRGGYFRVSYRY